MNWEDYIHSDSKILRGKPVVKGTRLAVDFILELFASGWTTAQVLEGYPSLTQESLQAVFSFARECTRDVAVYNLPAKAVKSGDAVSG